MMDKEHFRQLRAALDAKFNDARAEYLANISALDRVAAADCAINGVGRRRAVPKGVVLGAVKSAIGDLSSEFTVRDLFNKMRLANTITARQFASVRQSVQRCVDLRIVEVSSLGTGRRGSLFRRTTSGV